MKKLYIIIALSFMAECNAEIKEKKSNYSYYAMQPFFSIGARLSGWRNSLFTQNHATGLRVTGSVTQTYSSPSMKQFFLFDHHESLTVRGSAHNKYTSNTTHIRAEWLGLPNDFEGDITLDPHYESWGVLLTARKSLHNWTDWSFLKRSSLFVELPIVHSKTDLKFKQTNVTNAAPNTQEVYDIETAFNNKTWNFQKISTKSLDTLDLAELRLGLSSTFLCSDRALVALSSALVVPTTKQYENKYMFEPQAGYNGHPGMTSTVHIAVPLSDENDSRHYSLFIDAEHVLLARTKQHRTFDLKDKPWSRFLPMREKGELTNVTVPGVNVLTRNVRISPYSRFDVLVGTKINTSYFSFELGFGAWGHHKGRIKFTDAWSEIYAIAGDAANTSASESTITTRADNDDNFIVIKESDLDIDSALSPAKVIYKAHATLDIHYTTTKWGLFTTLGWEMQVPRNNTNGFKTWSLWVSTGGSF